MVIFYTRVKAPKRKENPRTVFFAHFSGQKGGTRFVGRKWLRNETFPVLFRIPPFVDWRAGFAPLNHSRPPIDGVLDASLKPSIKQRDSTSLTGFFSGAQATKKRERMKGIKKVHPTELFFLFFVFNKAFLQKKHRVFYMQKRYRLVVEILFVKKR